MPTPARIFVIHVSLHGIKTVWRRVAVPANVRLSALHRVIQGVMGWHDVHLHEFTARNGERFGVPEHDDIDPPQDESTHKLDEFMARPRDKLRYTYDFGDSWEHLIFKSGTSLSNACHHQHPRRVLSDRKGDALALG